MADVILKDRDGRDLTYEGVNAVKLLTKEGEMQTFIAGETQETTVELDFSQGDMTVLPEEGKFFSKVQIPKPANLVPGNIVKDVEIAGVVGTKESESVVAKSLISRAVNFYDPFGNLIESYTREEARTLTALPEGPEIEGFEFDTWTHTLEEVQGVEFFLDVGPVYKKNDAPVAILVLNITPEMLTTYLTLYMWSSSYKFAIDWGDGTVDNIVGASGTSSKIVTSHVFAEAGIKYVSIYQTADGSQCGFGYRYNANQNYTCISNSTEILRDSYSYFTPQQQLVSILVNTTGGTGYEFTFLRGCYNLKFISYYKRGSGTESSISVSAFRECINLECIAINYKMGLSAYDYCFQSCGIKRLAIGATSGGATAFKNCPNLTDLLSDCSTIRHADINQSHRLILTNTTTATISHTTPLYGTKNVYVPDDLVESYKVATGWSNIADYIKPISEYPDY